MSDFRSAADQPSLDAIARSDGFLDALATRERVDVADHDDEVLAELLEQWRDDLRWPPASALVSEQEAVAALQHGLAARQRARRALALVGSVAAAVLALGGFGALVGTAHPGDALYGVHTMLFGEPPSVHDDEVELAAKSELAKVQQMIAQGQWDQAQGKLAAVSDTVQSVNDSTRKQGLLDEVNQLNAKVASRDPNATVPPGSPAGPAPVSSVGSASTSGGSTTAESALPETTSGSATSASTEATTSTTISSSPAAPSTPSSPAPQAAWASTSTSSAPVQSPSQAVGVTPTTTAAIPATSPSLSKAGDTAAQTTPGPPVSSAALSTPRSPVGTG
ncbi:hypothetical protein BMW24_000135 [Mycobacterium heckeshornense]|uniref:Uncharacterized protein n=1 Tax=Mycobacterium heckeshornense TaxID=110505 RepID=A0A2G8BIZ2_9MYCO|nr:anti-sigma-D factor RsdA [Mycobacterium heckeshornense]MCV7033423.1 hypothetical protein [Mycobacterium heckeshornense]PIJ37596.1 hypothetical protein BMW24_000135 [Mycobacterium heckeshornense]BCO37478.1 hypothetical protein MHEC_39110 [Mycobacterium heckeshornense]